MPTLLRIPVFGVGKHLEKKKREFDFGTAVVATLFVFLIRSLLTTRKSVRFQLHLSSSASMSTSSIITSGKEELPSSTLQKTCISHIEKNNRF